MFKLIAILLLSIVITVLSGFLSDKVTEFHFTKVSNESDQFNFDYRLDNGSIFNGTAHILNINESQHIYMMIGADNDIYWAKFTNDEFNNVKRFSKCVRSVLKIDDNVFFLDNYKTYNLRLSTATLKYAAYPTVWDLDNVCFMVIRDGKGDYVTFVMRSKNNSRTYEGGVSKINDSNVWMLKIEDNVWDDEVYKVEFTDNELKSHKKFCKAVNGDETYLSDRFSFDQFIATEIDPNLLKALVG